MSYRKSSNLIDCFSRLSDILIDNVFVFLSHGDQYRLLVACLDGSLHTYAVDPINGGEARRLRSQKSVFAPSEYCPICINLCSHSTLSPSILQTELIVFEELRYREFHLMPCSLSLFLLPMVLYFILFAYSLLVGFY